MPPMYLLGRYLDPMLGVFTGILAYQLHETNPRSRPEAGHTLRELISWQIAESQAERKQRNALLELQQTEGNSSEWERLQSEIAEDSTG